MKSISKPTKTTYWVARDETGDVLHTGQTNPDQETVTGQSVFELTEDEATQLAFVSDFTAKLPDLPEEGEWVEERMYNYNGTPVKARQPHYRTHHNVEDVPALFIRVPDPTNIPEWSSFQSHEFQAMDLGTKVVDEGNTYELIDQGQGYRKPSGEFGHFGWEQV